MKIILLAVTAVASVFLIPAANAASPISGKVVSAPASDGVDLSALRWYVRSGEQERIDAEVARLKKANPGWTPPADLGELLEEGDGFQPAWDALAKGNAVEARRIGEKIAGPGGKMPPKLVEEISRIEARAAVIDAERRGNWPAVLSAAKAMGKDGEGCNGLDVRWARARAEAGVGRLEDSYRSYADILAACPSSGLATVQKASQVFSGEHVDALVALGGRTPQMEAFLKEKARGEAAEKRGRMLARIARGEAVSDSELSRIMAETVDRNDAAGASAFGWRYLSQEKHSEAVEWFRRSLSWKSDVKAAEGLALSLHQSGREQEFKAVLAQWGSHPEIAKLAATGAAGLGGAAGKLLEGGRREECVQEIMNADPKDSMRADVRVILGWCLMGLDRPVEAASAFEAAKSAPGGTARTAQDASKGLAILAAARQRYQEAAQIATAAGLPAVDVKKLSAGAQFSEILDLFHANRHRLVLARLDALRAQGVAIPHGIRLLEGWSTWQLGYTHQAEEMFIAVHNLMMTEDSLHALRIAKRVNNQEDS